MSAEARPTGAETEREAREAERRRWMAALAEALAWGRFTVSTEASILAHVNGYTGEPNVLDIPYLYECSSALRARRLCSTETPTEGEAVDWDLGFKSGFWAGHAAGYHDGASGNAEDPEPAWDDLVEAGGAPPALSPVEPEEGA